MATARSLASARVSGAPRSLIVDGTGTGFDLAAADPSLIGEVASFLEGCLSPPASAESRTRVPR